MIKILSQELEMEKSLKQRISFICEFCKTTPTFINGSIRKIDKSNLNYIEPHRIIIKNITFLAFNYSTDIYIKNLIYNLVHFLMDRIYRNKDKEKYMEFAKELYEHGALEDEDYNLFQCNRKLDSHKQLEIEKDDIEH